MDIQAARAKRSSMPNVPPPPISARMTRATAPEARTRPLEQLSGVLRMMFAVASVKRAETAFPGLHGAVEVVTRGRHVEQLSGREHLAVPGDARPMARILRVYFRYG